MGGVPIGQGVWLLLWYIQLFTTIRNEETWKMKMVYAMTLIFTAFTIVGFLAAADILDPAGSTATGAADSFTNGQVFHLVFTGFICLNALQAIVVPRLWMVTFIDLDALPEDGASIWTTAARWFIGPGYLIWASLWASLVISLVPGHAQYYAVPLAASWSLTGVMWTVGLFTGTFEVFKPKKGPFVVFCLLALMFGLF